MYEARAYSAASATSPLESDSIKRRATTDTDVQIEILFCGVCHSDLNTVRDEWNSVMPTVYPCVPGHEIVGRVMEKLGDNDVLWVMSDHGCTSFRRGVNLNAWLREHGYLVLKDDADGTEQWLQSVDWSRTRAYVLGLTGMYVNMKGRESEGIVEPGEEA